MAQVLITLFSFFINFNIFIMKMLKTANVKKLSAQFQRMERMAICITYKQMRVLFFKSSQILSLLISLPDICIQIHVLIFLLQLYWATIHISHNLFKIFNSVDKMYSQSCITTTFYHAPKKLLPFGYHPQTLYPLAPSFRQLLIYFLSVCLFWRFHRNGII